MKQVQFEPPLDYKLYPSDGNYAFLFTHGERTDIEDQLFHYMAKDLSKEGISVMMFRLPFRVRGERAVDGPELDSAFQAALECGRSEFPDKRWIIGGHSIGGSAAIRLAGLTGEILPVVILSYPMYPSNRPELLDVSGLYALMGPSLFITGDKGNRGTHDRISNQLMMISDFAKTKLIRGADHQLAVKGTSPSKVANWIARSIASFTKELY